MATRFEIVLHGENPVALRAAGEEALNEIERLEGQLSLFRSSSEIAHLNARAAREPVRVSPPVFALLQHARNLSAESGGAFDITVAPLVRCWGFMGGSGRQPAPEEVEFARKKVGMDLVVCNPAEQTVSFAVPGVMLDLGAIGKGYAIDRAAELLREAGVQSALLHGGTSTVCGLGAPPGKGFWQVAIENPRGREDDRKAELSPQRVPFATVQLRDEALSVSAVWGKYFHQEGKVVGHVIDPRTGQAVSAALLAAVVLPSATETDALSTALLTLGPDGHDRIANLRQGMRTLVAAHRGGGLEIRSRGIEPRADN